MKLLTYIPACGALLVACLLAPACKKALDTKEYSALTPENFYQSTGDANAALMTLYVPFTSNWGNDDPGTSGPTWYAGLYNADIKTYFSKSEVGTDEVTNTATDGNTGPLVNYTWGPSTWTLASGAEATYSKISYVAKATDIMTAIGASSAVPDAVKKQYIAEAQALRAWLMYVLYDFYGPVNVKVNEATLTDTAETARPSDTAYVNQMIGDLNQAMPNLAVDYNGDAANWGRMSQGVAKMLLLKIYMMKKMWPQAQAAAQDIISMGVYSLMTGPGSYAAIFNTSGGSGSNPEVIYGVPANQSSPNFWPQEVFPQDFASAEPMVAPRAVGWITQFMPWAFYNKYDAGDQRLTTILSSYTNTSGVVKNESNGMPGAIPLKYTAVQPGLVGQNLDVVVFRYADVLLSMAEAINEQTGPAGAYAYVNQVRERAGVSDFAGMTQVQLRQAILDERGRELYCEGLRRQDLIRAGVYISTAVAAGKNAQPYDVLFPIPESVILQGRGIIQQNPGYTN
ncbi:MAG TPA: RagB/SusD family nutrient uptake outer membrane protein [Dinghuibacter sp.]|uniref:RagB/SusD family nutrient uptake outer membrane protein n=1 Tax=Dinghuibacter sp. TaxID=2024697 RepID=UPI002B7154AE|nr:RagB/SusD family nutrient uptake outer membrane protein [Dinghuibacter sp.]HTJ13461.1 RagB/SusD family nutrient uptake outer membrane protein [Dinghuibacter sp.]